MPKVTEIAAGLAAPLVEACGCTLWDVEYVKEAGEWYLRVYIDREGGVSINDCEAVSRPLSDALDEADPGLRECQPGRGAPAGRGRPHPGELHL